jgi:outer membrane protein OmpA-like peptidoglycan-associated protein
MTNKYSFHFERASKLIILFAITASLMPARANVVGVDAQNFNPTTNGIDFVTVESSETLQPGILNLGLFLNLAQNTLPRIYDTTKNKTTSFKDRLLSSDLNVGLGLLSNWDVGVSMPAVLNQSFRSDNSNVAGRFAENGVNEIRLNTKYRFFGDEAGGMGAQYVVSFNMIEDNPYAGENPTPVSSLLLVADNTFGDFAAGLNLGYRFRDSDGPLVRDPLIEPIQNQYIASLALSYLFEEIDTKLITEVFSSFPAEDYKKTGDRDNSSAELLVGIKHDLMTDLSLHFGAGTEIFHGTASPDWRVYTGLNWNFGPLWSEEERPVEEKINRKVRREQRAAQQKIAKPKVTESKPTYTPVGPPPVPADFGIAVPARPGAGNVYILRDIRFGINQATPTAASQEVLNDLADYLITKKNGFNSIVIEGHTDSTGSGSYNLVLSQRRAARIKSIIVHKYGLDPRKIESIGYGESKPIRSNANYQGRAANRRVQVRIK